MCNMEKSDYALERLIKTKEALLAEEKLIFNKKFQLDKSLKNIRASINSVENAIKKLTE